MGVSRGVTAASAIAALQEASGKGSRDSTLSSYRAYANIVELCIELIRQFYHIPRKFRILGSQGIPRFVSYTNRGILPIHQGTEYGQDMGMRLPVFDIRISAQKKDAYSRAAQNELALSLFKAGFFDADKTEQALACLELMSFEGREAVVRALRARAAEANAPSAGTESADHAQPTLGWTDKARRTAAWAPMPRER